MGTISEEDTNTNPLRDVSINAINDWSRIDTLIMAHYPVGKSAEGNEAHLPLILLKCLLLRYLTSSSLRL
jgi:hypothetical protein